MSMREAFEWRDLVAALFVSLVFAVLICFMARTLMPLDVLAWAIMAFVAAYPSLITSRARKRALDLNG